jgi:hypothetical protein
LRSPLPAELQDKGNLAIVDTTTYEQARKMADEIARADLVGLVPDPAVPLLDTKNLEAG